MPSGGQEAQTVLTLDCGRWMLIRLLRAPGAWLTMGLLVLLWPSILAWSPVAWSSGDATLAALPYELAFLGALAGGAHALARLEQSAWIVERAGPARRLAARWISLATAAVTGAIAASMIPVLGGNALGPDLAARLLLATAHVTSVAALLAVLPLPQGSRSIGLFLAAWLLPRALGPIPSPGAELVALLDAARVLDPRLIPGGTPLLASLGPILALLLLTALLDTPRPTSDPPPHALRHPR